MAKLAVIFFLFALCAVAMSARVAREEPTKSPLDQVQDQIQKLAANFQQLLQNPELQKTLQDFGDKVKEAGQKVADHLSQPASPPKA